MGSHSRLNQMIARQGKVSTMVLAISLALFASGCKKKTPAPPPPPAPAPIQRPAPVAPSIVSFEAEPSTIERGGDSTLKWSVTGDATSITITPGIGTVAASGTRRVFPGQTTVYTLTAGGPGGTNTANATVTVNAPAPPPPAIPPPTAPVSLSDFLERQVKEPLFDNYKKAIPE